MSVYEYLIVEKTRTYSDKEIRQQFLELGCIKYPKDHDDYVYIQQHGIIKSPEFINMAGGIVSVPFNLPKQRKHNKSNEVYDIFSCKNMPLPLVAFEWVRRYFPKDTHIHWEIETNKLFSGKISNYFKTRKIKKEWLEEERKRIEFRRGVHKFHEK